MLVRLAGFAGPERAHGLAISGLKRRRQRPAPDQPHPRLGSTLFGQVLPNPIGLAAGFDKNGEVSDAMLGLGFGFVEVGTVTPYPQFGNPRPRVFRLKPDGAVINRLGFNNLGHDAVERNLALRRGRGGIVGVNIGANRNSLDRVADYVAGVNRFAPLATYLTINISSPNTEGLRDFQKADNLGPLLAQTITARFKQVEQLGRSVPLFLKIAPDMDDGMLQEIIATAIRHNVDGLIIANTTLSREGLTSRRKTESGGLSGPPLFTLSTAMLARARQIAGGRLLLIGVGGVDSAKAAWRKFVAGADLIQLYTGMTYQGFQLPRLIQEGLVAELDNRNIDHLDEIKGIETIRWAALWPQ